MRTLVLMRHAQALKLNEAPNDYARALTNIGRVNAEVAASRLPESTRPELIIASSALRTSETACIVASFFSKELTLLLQPALYQADAKTYFSVLQSIPNVLTKVMIVGHNPSISILSSLLSQQSNVELEPAETTSFQTTTNLGWSDLTLHDFHLLT